MVRRLQEIEWMLVVLALAAPTLPESPPFPAAIAGETRRLQGLIPENERGGMAGKEIVVALEKLQSVESDLASDQVHLAFERLASARDVLESAAFLNRHLASASDPGAFLALWESEGRSLQSEMENLARKGFPGRSALVRARAEIAISRVVPYHRAARLYAEAGAEGGLYYLGSARAASSFAAFCSSLGEEPGASPRFGDLGRAEARLSKGSLDAYGRGNASSAYHQDFIRLDSALKEARKLVADGYVYGAAASLLEARLRLSLIESTKFAPKPAPETAGYRSRLFDPAKDHSLARALWERALELASSTSESDRVEAAVLLEEVLPFYFEILEDE